MRTHKIVLLMAVLLVSSVARAEKFAASRNGKEVVAHTRRAPVMVHKVFPPYGLGLHVYAGRGEGGGPNAPSGTPESSR